jgi:DNA-binding MarR family transcriptional regulator
MRCSKCNKEELSLRFFNALKVFKKKFNFQDDIYHLTIGQIEILHFIKSKKQILMKDVSDFLGITPPSATSLINNLVLNDMLERSYDRSDRRIVLLSLTKKGSEIFEKAHKERMKIFEKIMSSLSPEEKSSLLNILKKIND